MNRYFVDQVEVDRLVLQDNQWVEIRRKLTIGDRDRLAAMLVELEMPVAANREERRKLRQQTATAMRLRPSTVALLLVSITDWSFADGNGAKRPITKETLDRMTTEFADFLMEEIDRRNPSSVGQEVTFLQPSTTS